MKIIKFIAVWFVSAFILLLLFTEIIQEDENGMITLTAFPTLAILIIPIACGVLAASKKKKAKEKHSTLRKIKYCLQKKIKESKEKKKYDSLSEAEKWKLERESNTSIKSAMQKPQAEELSAPRQFVVDFLTDEAAKVIFETGQASVSMLQRRLHIGYQRALDIIGRLEEIGIIGPFTGSSPRTILVSEDIYRKNANVVDYIPKTVQNNSYSGLDINQIIEDENEWRRVQQGLSETDYELNKVDAMGGHEFENWCAGLLIKNGFSNVKLTPVSGDQGVDILAEKDGIRYAIQCKCYSSDLGNTPIQEVNTGRAIYHCQIGVVMTNRYFTKGAKDAAESTGVLLWDRDKLKRMMDT